MSTQDGGVKDHPPCKHGSGHKSTTYLVTQAFQVKYVFENKYLRFQLLSPNPSEHPPHSTTRTHKPPPANNNPHQTMTSSALARIATRSLTRRSAVRSTTAVAKSYSNSAVALGGATPPLPPFARIPPESEKLVEQYDAIWDDGVAPEVTLDFDCQHIDSGEALVRVYIRRVFLCAIFANMQFN